MTAAPTALPRLPTPLSSWPPLPVPVGMLPRPMPLFCCLGACGGLTTKAPFECTISSAFWRSSSYCASISRAMDASSMLTSISQLFIQLPALRLVDPMRVHRPSATAVLACSIGPRHSKIRIPASRRNR